ncbi:V-type ATPase, C subunit [Verruconis gallopava]|uniref:V-type proton ATPase proteolipid subunit n=1 Tax=Verruconis gallopava TaxID=253628 RepID=A0A0D1XLT6_9PEZI|nr:V-type ATPase, C subunit [Verruconis gallopava]KIW03381.1 V-type ATPase, C subunit [Verruconis gallopava]
MYPSDQCPVYAPFFSALGCAVAMCLSALGAAYGTAKAGVGITMSGIMRPDTVIRNSVPVVMAAILAIYGLVVSVMITNRMQAETHLFTAFVHLGAGIAVGVSALGAGFTIGITGDAGVRGVAQQPRLFMPMMLIQIFSEVLGLYGMVVALLMLTRASSVNC